MAAKKAAVETRKIKYGRLWPNKPWGQGGKIIQCPDWYIELTILRDYDRMKAIPGNKLVSWPQHMVNFTSIVFGHPNSSWNFEWNTNALRILGSFCKHDILAIAGHKSCVPYETRLLDPTTGLEHEIGWLCENNIAPVVMTLDGPKQAEIPFLKGEAEIFQVVLANGNKFRCTAKHRLLTPSGWKQLDRIQVGGVLVSYKPAQDGHSPKQGRALSGPSLSSSESSLSIQRLDAHCSRRTVEDSQGYYSGDPDPCDAPPLLEAGSDQSFSPSQGGAQGYSDCASVHSDGPENISLCSHPYLRAAHLSKGSGPPSSASSWEMGRLLHCAAEKQSHDGHSFSHVSQFDTGSPLPCATAKQLHDCAHTQSLDDGDHCSNGSVPYLQVTYSAVESITNTGTEKFYDITVPGPAHYFAQGAIHHNSGKTQTLAMIGVMWFFLWPEETKVIVTSTTVSSAKAKVWGEIKKAWAQLERFFGPSMMPGKLVDSQNIIRFEKDGVKHETRGIVLLASESSSEKESADKLQGTKAERMIIMGDEFSTLKHSLLNTVMNNLTANKQCKLAGAFNPSSYYDPGGIISRPTNGWSTITEEDDGWETLIEPYGLKGYCIRFDGEKSPNVLLGEERWKGLLTLDKLEQIGPIGTKTKGYYEQIRGFWSPIGDRDSIYTEAEIISYGADRPVTTWVEPPMLVAALDPGFVHGGDRAVLTIGKSGVAVSVDTQMRQKVCEITHIYVLDEDITNKTVSKSEWVVKLTKQRLEEHKVDVRNFGIDATGGGESFGALIARDIGLGFLNIKFSGKGSDMPVSRNDSRKGSERFFNLASELWYVGRELVRTGQFRGLKPDIVRELVARTYEEKAGVVQIESKHDMMKRIRKSPDVGDSALMTLHVARIRFGVSSTEKALVVNRARNNFGNPLDFLTKKPVQSNFPSERLISYGGGYCQV